MGQSISRSAVQSISQYAMRQTEQWFRGFVTIPKMLYTV